jgi:hypothetical protein
VRIAFPHQPGVCSFGIPILYQYHKNSYRHKFHLFIYLYNMDVVSFLYSRRCRCHSFFAYPTNVSN